MKFLATLLLLLTTALHADEPPHLRFWVPSAEGDKYQVKLAFALESEDSSKLGDGDSETATRNVAGRFEGVVTESKVSGKGMPLQISFKVTKSEYRDQGQERPLFEPGDEIVSTQAQPADELKVNGQEPTPNQALAIGYLFTVLHEETPTPAELFGFNRAAVAGQKWEVDHEKMQQAWRLQGVPIDKPAGTVTYTGPAKIGDQPAIAVEMEYKVLAKDFDIAGAEIPLKMMSFAHEGKTIITCSPEDPKRYGVMKAIAHVRSEASGEIKIGGDATSYSNQHQSKVAMQMDWEHLK